MMKSNLFIVTALTIVSTALIAGCSSKDDANVSNFETVISDHYATEGSPATCIGRTFESFPYQLPENQGLRLGGINLETQLAALADAGLIESVGQDEYDLTEEGQAAFTSGDGFCFGEIRISEVTNFTEPTATNGYTISHVKYIVEISDRPEWSESPLLVETYALSDKGLSTGGMFGRNETPEAREMVLIETNNGWVTEHEMN